MNKGAEQEKIEAMQLKIKRLLAQIDVSVSSIRAISRRIHQAMNEELLPQLRELNHGYVLVDKPIYLMPLFVLFCICVC